MSGRGSRRYEDRCFDLGTLGYCRQVDLTGMDSLRAQLRRIGSVGAEVVELKHSDTPSLSDAKSFSPPYQLKSGQTEIGTEPLTGAAPYGFWVVTTAGTVGDTATIYTDMDTDVGGDNEPPRVRIKD